MKRLTEITKRDIYELFRDGCTVEDLFLTENVEYPYYGRLEEIDFLERLYDLENMESNDPRHENAKGDIIRHTINNDDYPYCWVFEDDRFGLRNGTDETFLKFVCEIFHPLVRDEKKQWGLFLEKVNNLIKEDGYELYIRERISGREVYDYRLYGVDVVDKMDKNAIRDLIDEFKTTTEVVDIDINSNMYNLYVASFPEFSDKQRYVGEKEELQNIVTNKNLPNYAFGECKTFVSMRCYSERIFSEEDFKSVSTEQCIEKIKSNMIRQKVNYSDTEDLALKATQSFEQSSPEEITSIKEHILIERMMAVTRLSIN